VFAGRYEVDYQGELCLCQTTPGAFGTAPFFKGELLADFSFFGGGVTSSDWLVSDLTEAAGSQVNRAFVASRGYWLPYKAAIFQPNQGGVL
jgi:hypothetical protein